MATTGDGEVTTSPRRAPAGAPATLASTLAVVAASLPTMAVEEFWHGRPMIDQPGRLWIVPASILLVAFAGGGWAVARRSQRVVDSAVVGLLAVAVLIAADIIRRHWITHQGYPAAVTGLWVGCGAVLVGASVVGGALPPGSARR